MKKVLMLVMFSLLAVGFAFADDDDMKAYQSAASFCKDGKQVEYAVAIGKVQDVLKKKHPKYYIEDVDIEYTVYKVEAEKQGFGPDLIFIVDICTGVVDGPYRDY